METWARRIDFRRWPDCRCHLIVLLAVSTQMGDPLTVYRWFCPTCDVEGIHNILHLGKPA
jgi:hypothetical protein